MLKAYKPPASITDKFLIASFTGTLRGIVLATDGKPVANAAVQLTNNQTKVKIVVKPDGEGKFVADGLVAGDYSIITSADRFTDQQKFTRLVAIQPAGPKLTQPAATWYPPGAGRSARRGGSAAVPAISEERFSHQTC